MQNAWRKLPFWQKWIFRLTSLGQFFNHLNIEDKNNSFHLIKYYLTSWPFTRWLFTKNINDHRYFFDQIMAMAALLEKHQLFNQENLNIIYYSDDLDSFIEIFSYLLKNQAYLNNHLLLDIIDHQNLKELLNLLKLADKYQFNIQHIIKISKNPGIFRSFLGLESQNLLNQENFNLLKADGV